MELSAREYHGSLTIEELQADVEYGIMTQSDIARKHCMTSPKLSRLIKMHRWTRHGVGKLAERTEVALLAASSSPEQAERALQEGVEMRVALCLSHRKSVNETKEIIVGLLTELKEASSPMGRAELEAVAGEMTVDDKTADRYQAFMRAISLNSRAQTAKSLVSAFRDLLQLERQIFGLDKPVQGELGVSPSVLNAAAKDTARESEEARVLSIFAEVYNGSAVVLEGESHEADQDKAEPEGVAAEGDRDAEGEEDPDFDVEEREKIGQSGDEEESELRD